MNTNAKEQLVGSFLVSKNKEKEYTTIVSPEFNLNTDIALLLKKTVSRYNQETPQGKAIYTEITDTQIGKLFVISRTSWATEIFIGGNQNNILYDSYSRPIPFIEGFVLQEPVTENVIASINFNIVHQQVVDHYKHFWESGQISNYKSELFKLHKSSDLNEYYALVKTTSVAKITSTDTIKKTASIDTIQKLQNKNWRCLNTFCLNPDARYYPEICSVTFSANGEYVAARYNNQIIQIWDWKQNKVIKILDNCKFDSISSLAFNSDGNIITTGMICEKGEAIIKLWQWNLDKNVISSTQSQHNKQVYAVAFHEDPKLGEFLVTGIQNTIIKLWRLRKNQDIDDLVYHNYFSLSNSVRCFDINRNGTFIVGGNNSGVLTIWNFETSEVVKIIQGHNSSINSIAFSKNNKTFASSSQDKDIKIWSIETNNEIRYNSTLNFQTFVECLTFSPINERMLVAGCKDNKTRLFDYVKSELITTLDEHKGEVTSVAFNPDGFLATGSTDGTVKIWFEN